jgi:hypothetical protein
VHGERLASGEVLASDLAVAAAEERAESTRVEQRGAHRMRASRAAFEIPAVVAGQR